MQTLLRSLKIMVLTLTIGSAFLLPTVASATAKDQVCEGVGLTGGTTGCTDPTGGPSVDSTVRTVVNLLSLLVGVIAVIMVIVGGLKYILSSGDSNNVNSAKNTILYALVGLVIVVLAQVIVRFVLNKTTEPGCPVAGQTVVNGKCSP